MAEKKEMAKVFLTEVRAMIPAEDWRWLRSYSNHALAVDKRGGPESRDFIGTLTQKLGDAEVIELDEEAEG